jgi:hypothetical protein
MSEWCPFFQLRTHCNEHGDEIEVADCVECSEAQGFKPTLSPAIGAILKALPGASETAIEVAGAILLNGRFTDYAIAKGLARMMEVQKSEEVAE